MDDFLTSLMVYMSHGCNFLPKIKPSSRDRHPGAVLKAELLSALPFTQATKCGSSLSVQPPLWNSEGLGMVGGRAGSVPPDKGVN